MLAACEPRLSSCMSWPAEVSKILIRVPCGSRLVTSQGGWKQMRQQLKKITALYSLRFTYFLGCGGYSRALQVESDAAQRPFMGGDVNWGLLCVGQVHYLNMARMSARER